MIGILVLQILFGSSFFVGKMTLPYVEPLFLGGTRMIVAAGIMFLIQLLRKKRIITITPQDRGAFLKLGILFAVAYTLYFWSLQHMTSSEAAFWHNLTPFFSVILSYFWFAEVMTSQKWLGLAIGSIGFLPMMLKGATLDVAEPDSYYLLAKGVMALSVFAFAFGWVVQRHLVRERHYSVLTVNGIGMLLGGMMMTTLSYGLEQWPPFSPEHLAPLSIGFMGQVFLANLGAYNLYSKLLLRYSATILAFFGLTTPFFTALLRLIFLGEMISWQLLLSLGIIMVGLYLFYQEELRQGYIAAK